MIKLYAASIRVFEEEAYYKKMLARISPERKSKVERYKKDTDKKRSLAAELLCRQAFEAFLGQYRKECIGQALVTAYGEDGKPYCVNMPAFHFNLSHSGEYAVCAVSQREVGVDIQKHKKYQLGLAERFFAEEEVRQLREAAEEEREKLFYEIWTLKESYMKYTGKGMKLEMKTYLEDTASGRIIENGIPKEVYVHHLHFKEGYAITVCGEEKETYFCASDKRRCGFENCH